jgi:hypothetical protein
MAGEFTAKLDDTHSSKNSFAHMRPLQCNMTRIFAEALAGDRFGS